MFLELEDRDLEVPKSNPITCSPALEEVLVSDPATKVASFEEAFLVKGGLCGGFVSDVMGEHPGTLDKNFALLSIGEFDNDAWKWLANAPLNMARLGMLAKEESGSTSAN